MNYVRLFMKDGRLTKFCSLLSPEQRRRIFRICRVVRRKEFKRMLSSWKYEEIEVNRYVRNSNSTDYTGYQ